MSWWGVAQFTGDYILKREAYFRAPAYESSGDWRESDVTGLAQ